jgi:hypothetical protein
MPTRTAVLRAVLLGAVAFAVPASSAGAATAPADAAAAGARTKSCRSVSGRAGGVDRIRLSESFACRDARADIGGWLNLFQPSGPRPWTCTHRGASVTRWSCHLRTSFGGTRPLRRYTLTFRLLDA